MQFSLDQTVAWTSEFLEGPCIGKIIRIPKRKGKPLTVSVTAAPQRWGEAAIGLHLLVPADMIAS